ncbi:MAG: DUF6504 family protein [Phycisphaerae bacterium]
MAELISESITPLGGKDTALMAKGEPGLPEGFRWRGEDFRILSVVRAWKVSTRDRGLPDGELYLRRHCYELVMSDRSRWSIYFVRQAPRSGNRFQRWFLYTRADGEAAGAGDT